MAKSLHLMGAHQKADYQLQLHPKDQRAAKGQNLRKRRS
jgi:hypothetical protein